MQALLMKDFYMFRKTSKFFLIMVGILALAPTDYTSSFAIFYITFLPVTALAYDGQSRWDALARMMPYTPSSLVLSKYIIGYAGIGVTGIISIVSRSVYTLVKGGAVLPGILTVFILACFATVFMSLSLPFIFKFGVEKGRKIFFIVVALLICLAIVGTGIGIAGFVFDPLRDPTINTVMLTLVAVLMAVIINVISVKASVIFYKKREF